MKSKSLALFTICHFKAALEKVYNFCNAVSNIKQLAKCLLESRFNHLNKPRVDCGKETKAPFCCYQETKNKKFRDTLEPVLLWLNNLDII